MSTAMAMPGLGRYCALLLLLLSACLLYSSSAFRVRDSPPVSSDACQSGKCSTAQIASSWTSPSTLQARRAFEKVSARGSFAKQQIPHNEPDETLRKKEKKGSVYLWSKLSKNDEVDASEDEDAISASDEEKMESDDEIIQIEVEDEDELVGSREEEIRLKEKQKHDEETKKRKKEAEEKMLREEIEKNQKEIEEKNRKEIEKKRKDEEEQKKKVEQIRKREEEVRRKREEAERVLIEEAERRLKEEQEWRIKAEAEERRLKEEEAKRLKNEEEQRLKEERDRRLKEEELRIKEEKERLLKEERKKLEAEKKLKEEEERRMREEEERKRQEEKRKREEEEKRKQEDERRKREEEDKRKREEENRRREEEENRRRQEEEKRRREEEEKMKREEERKQKELERKELEKKKKEDEERKKKELEREKADKMKKLKEEEVRKKRELELLEAQKTTKKEDEQKNNDDDDDEKNRDKEEDKKRLERLKKEAKDQKLRSEQEKKKREKLRENGDEGDVDDEDEIVDSDDDEDDSSIRSKSKLDKVNSIEITKSAAIKKTKDPLPNVKPKTPSTNANSKPNKPESIKKPIVKVNNRPRGPRASVSLTELNDMILTVPTFVPNFTAVEDPVCQQHGMIFLRQLRGYKLWALQMLDSSAKIPAGLLRGNVNQLGDFDQCLGVAARVKIDEKTLKVQGKYCLASVDLYATHPATKLPVNLMQSRALIRGNMRDPGHFVPRFTTVNWALCLPAACSAKDARRVIEDAVDYYNGSAGIRFVVDVDPDMCYVKQKVQSYSKETLGVLYFYAFFVCLAIIATLRDYFGTVRKKGTYSERIIMAFSLKRTLKALFGDKETSSSDIGCIHGIRSLSTIALYVAHKLIPTSRIPYANRVSLTEVASNPLSLILRASLFYTDSFLLLSGVLTAYNMARELKSRDEIRWFCRFIARYLRLTPALLAVVFWYAFVMEHTGSGPQWNAAVKANADVCKENSWINLLYVQNFFPFEEMCATHTHQLALDMQLSLAAPALVFFLQMKPIIGIVIVFFLLQISATLRYLATTNNDLSLVIFHGMTIKHLYKTANLTYTLPLHRATPYLFGVSLGVLLHCTGKKVRIHKIFSTLGWLISLGAGMWSMFSPWRLARRDYTYDVEDAAHYAVISPVLTAICLSWAIFACFTNNGGIVNRILSSYWMVVFSKLSYAIYLSQFAVFFYNVGSTRYSSEFNILRALDPYEALAVVSASVVLTVLFDIPMQEVKCIILECSDTHPVAQRVESDKAKEALLSESTNGLRKPLRDSAPSEEEEEPRNWNWNRGKFTSSETREPDEDSEPYRSNSRARRHDRRQTIIRSEAYDEWNGRRRSGDYSTDDDRYLYPRERLLNTGYSRSPMRDLDAPIFRKSVSRERVFVKDADARDYIKKPVITISKNDDYQMSRSPRSSMSRVIDQQRSMSSESESELLHSRRSSSYRRGSSAEPRVASDEDDWEEDQLRLRRSRYFHERVSSQERERVIPPVPEQDEWNSLRRRSSAEGKLALLKEPLRPNMELWTVSKMQLGSSQDEDYDEQMYQQQRREYREKGPPLREEFDEEEQEQRKISSLPTSFEEEEENGIDFGRNDTNKITVQDFSRTMEDLSKIPMEDDANVEANRNMLDVRTGLFKRESIIKSQASEEDPEYLLPERPKLVEQEQEHPFKKAWQMQKSRSEEEGSFIVKETKATSPPLDKQIEDPAEEEREGAQSQSFSAPDVTCDVTFVWQARSHEADESKSRSRSETSSASFDLPDPDDDEQFYAYRPRRKSEEEHWTLDT